MTIVTNCRIVQEVFCDNSDKLQDCAGSVLLQWEQTVGLWRKYFVTMETNCKIVQEVFCDNGDKLQDRAGSVL